MQLSKDEMFGDKKPNRWANIILKVNGYKYTKEVLHWWKTKGRIVHGDKRAQVFIDELVNALSEFNKIHFMYDEAITIHFNTGTILKVRLTDRKGNPDYFFVDKQGKECYRPTPTRNRDKTPFNSLNRIIASIERTFKNINYIEVGQ